MSKRRSLPERNNLKNSFGHYKNSHVAGTINLLSLFQKKPDFRARTSVSLTTDISWEKAGFTLHKSSF